VKRRGECSLPRDNRGTEVGGEHIETWGTERFNETPKNLEKGWRNIKGRRRCPVVFSPKKCRITLNRWTLVRGGGRPNKRVEGSLKDCDIVERTVPNKCTKDKGQNLKWLDLALVL